MYSLADQVFSEALVKEMDEAMKEVNSRLAAMDQVPGLLAAKLLCRKPGNNFQVKLVHLPS